MFTNLQTARLIRDCINSTVDWRSCPSNSNNVGRTLRNIEYRIYVAGLRLGFNQIGHLTEDAARIRDRGGRGIIVAGGDLQDGGAA
jgi:hypothetical protein